MEWKEVRVDVDALANDALEKLSKGEGTPEVAGVIMVSKSVSKGLTACLE